MSGKDGLPVGFRDPFAPRWHTPEDESSGMSCIEWAVANVLGVKYPNIHEEIIFEAARRGGYIPPDMPFEEANGTKVPPVLPPAATHDENRQ